MRNPIRSVLLLILTIAVMLAIAGPASASVRGAFYYPWYPETWVVGGQHPHFTPTKGEYSSTDPAIIDYHIDAMKYARIQFGIASWFGRTTTSDTRVPALLDGASRDATQNNNTGRNAFRWSFLYECEGTAGNAGCSTTPGSPNPSSTQIASDLNYLTEAYNGPIVGISQGENAAAKRLIFVYGGPEDTNCGVADRWWHAQNDPGASNNYVVALKVFPGYETCGHQPDYWYQYAPDSAYEPQGSGARSTVAISPGFWKADEATARLARSEPRWQTNTLDMHAAQPKLQLISTFNEWGEGSAVESAVEWASPSGYGNYLARLRVNGQAFGTLGINQCNDGLDNDYDGLQDSGDGDCNTSGTDDREDGTIGVAAAPPPPPASKTILAAGDIQPTGTTASPTASLLSSTPHDAVLQLGDLQYESGALAQYNASYGQTTWGTTTEKAKSYPINGNHEHGSGLAANFCVYFGASGQNGPSALNPCGNSTSTPYYSYDIGSWHVASLDTGASDDIGGDLTAAQKAWLASDLAASTKTCKMVTTHHPPYSSGGHSGSAALLDDFQLAKDNGVDVWMSGHAHNYQRWDHMNAAGAVDPTGPRLFVVGTGGRSHAGASGSPVGLQAKDNTTYGVMKMVLSSTGYTWQFLPGTGTGSFTDSGSDSCS